MYTKEKKKSYAVEEVSHDDWTVFVV